MNLWDTGGLERHDSMTCSYFRRCQAVVLVYDVGNFISLTALHDWGKTVQNYSYLKEDVVISVWGNKSDTPPDSDDSKKWKDTLEALLSDFKIPESLQFAVSAKTGANVHTAFDGVISSMHSKLSSTGSGLIVPDKDVEEVLLQIDTKKNPETTTDGERFCPC